MLFSDKSSIFALALHFNYKKTMKITIIGAGAMGGAMAEGLLKSENFTPSDITVSDHNQPVLDHFASEGASVTLDNQLVCHR